MKSKHRKLAPDLKADSDGLRRAAAPDAAANKLMISAYEWLPFAVVGIVFSTLALCKIYGYRKGIIGGGNKSITCRLLGSCPSWSKNLNIAMTVFFLVVGASNIYLLVRLFL